MFELAILDSTSQQGSLRYLVQSPHPGIALSHRLFWVLHRVQAFLAINARRSVLILVIDSSRTAGTELSYELLSEGMCGDRRGFEGCKCFVRAGASRRGRLLVRDMRDRDRGRCAGFQYVRCAMRRAWNSLHGISIENKQGSEGLDSNATGEVQKDGLFLVKGCPQTTTSSSHHNSIEPTHILTQGSKTSPTLHYA